MNLKVAAALAAVVVFVLLCIFVFPKIKPIKIGEPKVVTKEVQPPAVTKSQFTPRFRGFI